MGFSDLTNNAELGIDYLYNCINDDGSFIYQINSASGKISNSYNILRHAGALFVLYQSLDLISDRNNVFLLDLSSSFLESHLMPVDQDQEILCIVENGSAKLGGTGLTLLAMIEKFKFKPAIRDFEKMKKLARFLTWMQESSGKFKSKLIYKNTYTRFTDFSSTYYPGEAILALINFYTIDPDPVWCRAAESGIRYLIRNPVLNKNGYHAHNHWLATALAKFYLISPDPAVYNELWLITNMTIQSIQKNYNKAKCDYTFSATKMSTRAETVIAALALEVKLNKQDKVESLTQTLQPVINYCLRFQIKDDLMKGSLNLKGGIKEGMDSENIRIDYVQHLMQVLLIWNKLTIEIYR